MSKLIIAGSRTFDDYLMLSAVAENLPYFQEIVSGGAKGADKLGERWAKNRAINISRFDADWHKYGKGAGMMRNWEMADYADALLAFWDGKSRGTADMIKKARHRSLKVWIFQYDQ